MNKQHTPGPWRWEINRKSKSIRLVGGMPMYDKTVMQFARWGMGGAVPMFNSAITGNQYNIMERVCDQHKWIAPFSGRAHHADWCAAIIHPDAALMQSAPMLLSQLLAAANYIDVLGGNSKSYRGAIVEATGGAA